MSVEVSNMARCSSQLEFPPFQHHAIVLIAETSIKPSKLECETTGILMAAFYLCHLGCGSLIDHVVECGHVSL